MEIIEDVNDWTTKELRREAVRLGIPGAETADRARLIEELEECLGDEDCAR